MVSRLRRLVTTFLWMMVVAGITVWMGLAVRYANLHGASPRTFWSISTVVLSLGLVIVFPRRRSGRLLFLCLFAGVLTWFFCLKPSSNLSWAPEYSVMPSAEVAGNLVHVRNIRKFDYRSETDFTPHYYDKTYDINKLRSVDYILSYWSGEAIAHAFVSFGFEGDEYLAVSIETRREKTESYSAVEGFFRQYELIYVVADERDLIRLRSNYRGEDVYLFRLRTPPHKLHAVFLDYVAKIDSLGKKPEFYNALTANCTTSILGHFRCAPPYPRLNRKVLLSGYSAEYAYDTGSLDTSRSFEELKRRSRITDVAKTAGDGPDFSRRIRAGLPMPAPNPDINP